MARIFALGESLMDIIFRNNQPVSAKAGGSMLNSSVSLGRLGSDIYFVSDYGKDKVGDMIEQFLNENQVNTSYIERFTGINTALALAFLDRSSDASYLFYKNLPVERLESVDIKFNNHDIILFGSFFAIAESVRKSLMRIISSASEAGATVIYDPNIRSPHLHEIDRIRPLVIENMQFADLVRGSDEDFNLIFGAHSAGAAYDFVQKTGCANLIYTSNKNGV
jgi:fructokinase